MNEEKEYRGIEGAIQKAVDEGVFDNLEMQGKPLRLWENPYEEPSMRMANRIMRDHEVLPMWLQARKTLLEDIENWRREFAKRWQRQQDKLPDLFGRSWEQIVVDLRQQADVLNKRIRDFNIIAPSLDFHIIALHFENEQRRICR